MIGTTIGPYQVLDKLGVGGMGEVYRAIDTRLDRTVAIKIVASDIANVPELRARFEREARALSSLNHPHICMLFDVGHQNGVDFIVLEYLEGETVAGRLARDGALETDRALKIAIDICGALDTAHRAGIVHRDLKPGNIMFTKSGAKLLDFGLAKSPAPAVATMPLSMLPTTPPNLTAQGAILGTFQYMAPEQIEGLESDARTDIFAFGALLFEMLTGRKAFEGKTHASLLGAILRDQPPPVSRVQPGVPRALDRIIGTCLAKDADDRYQSARDLVRDLKWVESGSNGAETAVVPQPSRPNRVAWIIAAALAITLIATAIAAQRSARGEVTPPTGAVQFTIAPPENTTFGGPPAGGTGSATQVALSPDGRTLLFVAGTRSTYQIWRRQIAALNATPIPGTEGGAFPFWSPDGQSIAFFADGKLKKIQASGGPPTILCDAPGGRGGSWSRDGVIVFAATPWGAVGLLSVSSGGGEPTALTKLDPTTGETSHRWPHFLPDGRHFLYTASTGTCCPAPKPARVRIGSLDVGEAAVTLFAAESSVSYSSGHLIFARDGTLLAQPFDADTRHTAGDAFPIAAGVSWEGSRYVGAAVSPTGTLVYSRSNSQVAQPLTWFDRQGRVLGTLGPVMPYVDLAMAPEQRRIAVAVGAGANRDVWLIDIARNVPSRQTFDAGTDGSPVWSPDGARVVFGRLRSGTDDGSLRQTMIDTSDADTLLLEGTGAILSPTDWSRDGRFIAYTVTRGFPPAMDIWVLPLIDDRKPFPLAQTEFLESSAVFSPDGRWVAYSTDEGGQTNVYVQPFLRAGGKYPISTDGGSAPTWRADGRELFYLAADGTLMAVAINAVREFAAGVPTPLFQTNAIAGTTTIGFGSVSRLYDATRDGQRFIVNASAASVAPLTVILNWPSLLKQ